MGRVSKAVHGTPAMYRKGCNCDECKKAWKDYSTPHVETYDVFGGMEEVRTLHGKTMPREAHGTQRGYNYWKCRCAACKYGWREAQQKRRNKFRRLTADLSTEQLSEYESRHFQDIDPQGAQKAKDYAEKANKNRKDGFQ
jgi:hypothetical protein